MILDLRQQAPFRWGRGTKPEGKEESYGGGEVLREEKTLGIEAAPVEVEPEKK